MPPTLHRFAVVLVLLLLATSIVAARDARRDSSRPAEPPTQAEDGPGGKVPAYDGLLAQHFGPDPDGSAEAIGYWLFEPTLPRPGVPPLTVSRLPVVLFLHAYRGGDPELYHAWIAHLVRRGAIVVFPDYQPSDPALELTIADVGRTAPSLIRASVQDAVAELASGDHARPELRRVAVLGHSLGAFLAADYAGTAAQARLPAPKALLLAMPACRRCDLAALAGIPSTAQVLVVVGDEADEDVARAIWAGLSGVPAEQRDYIRLRSDAHGDPPLVADHAQPATGLGTAVDALDWYGTWKWLDALMACAFADQWCGDAFGDTPEQRFLGVWSDGVPVQEPDVTDDPATP
jgi:acetyl esterase/lipase